MADIAWWFGFSPQAINELTIDELELWVNQANRQIEAKYSKA